MVTFKKTGWIIFIWVNDKRIGEIGRAIRGAKQPECPTCGHAKYKQVTRGYQLRIYDRLWRDGKLVPKGKGGCSVTEFKRLHQAKAKAEELFG